MKTRNQLRIKFTLLLRKKKEKRAKKIFFGSLFFIFLSVLGSLSVWFFRTALRKIKSRLKEFRRLLAPKLISRLTPLRILFLLAFFNLSIWGWLNQRDIFASYEPLTRAIKEIGFPIAMGKIEEGVIFGVEDAVKVDDLKRELMTESSLQKILGEEKNLNFSLAEERCQKNKLEGKSSELCGRYEKDEVLERELKKIDDQAKARRKDYTRNSVVGKGRCAKENDHSSKSDTKGKHTDEDCCPDPDEYPNPRCYYSPSGYKLMLKR